MCIAPLGVDISLSLWSRGISTPLVALFNESVCNNYLTLCVVVTEVAACEFRPKSPSI